MERRSSNNSISPSSSMGGLINSERKKPFLIGVAGGTASGKSTVCERIMQAVLDQPEVEGHRQIISLSQDSFYRELNEADLKLAKKGHFNFDHPDAFDNELMLSCLKDIREGKKTKVPVYDFITNSRVKNEFTDINPSDVVLIEGILVFYHSDIRTMFDMKLFVDTDADTRLARRVLRDIEDRGRDLETILTQYTTLVKPAFEEFCLPTKKFADVIIPRGAENTVAIELVAQHILDIIWSKKAESATKHDSPFTRIAIQLIGQHIKDILVVKEPLSVRQPIRLHTTLSEPGIISFLNNLNALCPKEFSDKTFVRARLPANEATLMQRTPQRFKLEVDYGV